jgi:putative cell wall-binding protein
LSQARFGPGVSTVFIATGASFPDALAGSPAAAVAGGPILLTARDGLPAATANELARLRPSRIVVLGGPGVVSDGVRAQLGAYAGRVDRWSGANRFETAAAISRSTFGPGVPVAYLATGSTFPDALSGGALAGRNRGPILLVAADSIPAATAAELARLRPAQVVVLGGPGVISEGVRIAAGGYATTGSAPRLSGANRFTTSVAISQAANGPGGSDTVFVATGTNFPDGLAGGAVAALVPGPILLVTPTQLPGAIATELARLNPDTVYVIGGTGAVSDGVVHAMDVAIP